MSPVPDDFEQLRRLLALKRHEQPPPGYFHSFSRQVIVRIESGELGDPVAASFWSFSGGSFLQRVWATLDARPVLAGAFGVAVCGFFVVGALMSDNTGTAAAANNPLPVVAQGSPVWQQASDTGFSSFTPDSAPTYQAPERSLFKELTAHQELLPSRLQVQPQQAELRLIPTRP